MKLELIIKLVKLANNNPNENEANSAARRVCKLIAEGDFKFVEDKSPKPKEPLNVYWYHEQSFWREKTSSEYDNKLTTKTCKVCGKTFRGYYQSLFCSFKCAGEHLGI